MAIGIEETDKPIVLGNEYCKNHYHVLVLDWRSAMENYNFIANNISRKNMDVNEHEVLSKITPRHNNSLEIPKV